MQQDFNLDPNLAVRLAFDKPVTRLERTKDGWGPVTYWVDEDKEGEIEILLGDEADLMFGDGFGNLLRMEYLLRDPGFSNQTFATIDPALQVQFLCASFTGPGNLCLCDETFQTEGLWAMDVYDNSWTMAGFNEIKKEMRGLGPTEAVPEPGTLLMVLSGLWLLGWSHANRARRSRK